MKIFRKLSAFVLAVALTVCSFAVNGNTAVYADEKPMLISTRLQEGSRAHGFTLERLEQDEDLNGAIQVWKHDRTGAAVYMIVNDDPERAFGIIFKTEPEDDTGKLHILEHASCAASEKYPGRDVFFDLSNRGFITDINATTAHSSTNYYIASLDEQELMNGADFYLDCAFNSAIRTDRRYFDREGWRYVIGSEDDPLDVTGIVYNEMKGVFSNIDSYTIYNSYKHLYPDSNYQYISGGVPDKILDLTYEELIDFYDLCYHPSNCTAIVYGDIDYNSWLEKFESYFGKYEKEEFTAPEKYVPKGGYGSVTEYFPVSADTEDVSGRILYTWDLPDELTYSQINAISMLCNYESELTSPIMQALNASGIGSDYSLFTNELGDQSQFMVYAIDADVTRAEEFKKIVDEQLELIAGSTLDKEIVDCMFESWELADALAFNSSGIGISVIESITQAVEAQDIENRIFDNALEEKIRKQFDDGVVLKLFKDSVIKNENKLLYSVVPKPGLAEENDAALAKKLADKKASLSKKELKKLTADSVAFDKWNETAGTIPETLEKLVTADPAKLETDAPVYETTVSQKNGVTICTTKVDSDVSYYSYSFDISNLSKTQAKYLKEYLNYLGLSTTTRSQEQVTNDYRKYLSGFNAAVSMVQIDNKKVPSLVISFYAFDDKIEQALDLVFDMLLNTDLENDYNVSYIAQTTSYFLSTYSDPSGVLNNLLFSAAADSDDANLLAWKLNGMSRYNTLKKALASEENFMKFISGMAAVRKKIIKRQNAVISVAGNEKTLKASTKSMLARLPKKNKTYKPGSITKIAAKYRNTAFELNTQASFLVSAFVDRNADVKTKAARMVALALMQDVMYIPEFRFGLGAYGGYCSANVSGVVFTELYRSPEFANSWKRILQTPDELEGLLAMLSDEDLDGYKLSIISELIRPDGIWNMAANDMYYTVSGDGAVPKYEVAKAVQELTAEDIAAAVPGIREIFEKMGLAVIGTHDEIEANKDLFDKIYVLK
ncbi:MAG: insulinase family protein [Lachnospiraceae bacterium]|nr:insulinase family protein [Lachnospiraceae bacterium]